MKILISVLVSYFVVCFVVSAQNDVDVIEATSIIGSILIDVIQSVVDMTANLLQDAKGVSEIQ